MKKIYVLFLLLSFYGCKKSDIEIAKDTVDKFYVYDSKNDYKSIDKLMNIQFYQAVPYYKFVEFLKSKKEKLGNYEKKDIENAEVIIQTNSSDIVHLKYKVKYSNKATLESFILEKKGDEYKILKYSID